MASQWRQVMLHHLHNLRSCGAPVFIAALLGCALLLTGNAAWSQGAGDAFFYSSGKKQTMTPSTDWVGVQLAPGATSTTVARAIRKSVASDTSVRERYYRRWSVLLVPVKAGTQNSARTAVRSVSGVNHVLRVFGSKSDPIIETDRFLIQFKPGVSAARAAQLVASQGATLVGPIGRDAPNGYVARVTNPETKPATSAANALYGLPEVKFSLPDLMWPSRLEFVPNDPLYGQQWHLNNSGFGGGTAGADVKAPGAWDITLGSPNITVAIVDTGIDIDHEEFRSSGKIVAPFDFVDNDNNPRPDPANDSDPFASEDHGTACSGVAVANGNNAIGVSGMAPNCRLMPIRLVSGPIPFSVTADTMRYCADNGADIISNSWRYLFLDTLPDVIKASFDYATTTGRGGKGCILLFAAGNEDTSADDNPLASYVTNISVAASTNQDRRAFYSNFGPSIDVCAPSNGGTLGITTTDRTGSVGYAAGNYTNDFGGTSSATPLVAGVAALVLSDDSSLTYTEVAQRLKDTADKIDPFGGGYDSGGHSDLYGYGRVNAARALQASTVPRFTISGRITLADGTPLSGVTVTLQSTGATTLTSATGEYTFARVTATTTLVVPTKTSFTFTPPNRTITVGPNAAGVDFVGTPPLTVNLIAPATNSSTSGTYLLRASTSNNALVQRLEFSRSAPPVDSNRLVNILIPDRGTAEDGFGVNQAGKIETASCSVSIRHTYIGDLRVSLTHLDTEGKLISSTVLYDHSGGGGQSIDQTFDNLPILGQDMAGTWKLQVTDDVAEDTGTLANWGLHLTGWVVLGNGTINGKEFTNSWNTATTPKGTYDFRARAFSGNAVFTDINTNISVTPNVFAINGQVLDSNGLGRKGIVIERRDGTVLLDKVTTRDAGLFTFTNVPAGVYTLVPIPPSPSVSFDKASEDVTITTANPPLVTFRIPKRYSITVTVKTAGGEAVPTVSFGALAATYTIDKQYVIANLLPGSYTLAPNKSGYSFNPKSQTVTILNADLKDVAFTGTPSLSISGFVRTSTNAGVGLATVTLENVDTTTPQFIGTVTTDSTGSYSFANLAPGKYHISVVKNDLILTRADNGFITLGLSSLTNINWLATPAFRIGGLVRSSGGTLAAVSMKAVGPKGTLSRTYTTRTGGTGVYEFRNLIPGSYTVTATLSDYTFHVQDSTDTAATVIISTTSPTNVNFIGTLVPQPPSGGGGGTGGGTTPLPPGVSSVTAAPVADLVRIQFTSALDVSTVTDTSHYSVTIDGASIPVIGVSYHTVYHMVTLTLRDGSIKYGSNVTINFSGIKTTTNQVLSGSVTVQAR